MKRVHLEAASVLLPWLLLGTTSIHVSAQDFDMGSEITDTMAHEIEVPSWVSHDTHTSASVSDSSEDIQPTVSNASSEATADTNSATKAPLGAIDSGLISVLDPIDNETQTPPVEPLSEETTPASAELDETIVLENSTANFTNEIDDEISLNSSDNSSAEGENPRLQERVDESGAAMVSSWASCAFILTSTMLAIFGADSTI